MKTFKFGRFAVTFRWRKPEPHFWGTIEYTTISSTYPATFTWRAVRK